MIGSATDQKIRPIPWPQANSIEYQAKLLYSGFALGPPRRTRLPILLKMSQAHTATAKSEYNTNNQVNWPVTKVRSVEMTDATPSGFTSTLTTSEMMASGGRNWMSNLLMCGRSHPVKRGIVTGSEGAPALTDLLCSVFLLVTFVHLSII